jgi:hypothetical protein
MLLRIHARLNPVEVIAQLSEGLLQDSVSRPAAGKWQQPLPTSLSPRRCQDQAGCCRSLSSSGRLLGARSCR